MLFDAWYGSLRWLCWGLQSSNNNDDLPILFWWRWYGWLSWRYRLGTYLILMKMTWILIRNHQKKQGGGWPQGWRLYGYSRLYDYDIDIFHWITYSYSTKDKYTWILWIMRTRTCLSMTAYSTNERKTRSIQASSQTLILYKIFFFHAVVLFFCCCNLYY